ncbi:MAG: glycosyltransferase family 2 protein [Phycisphaerales bacterium]|nr:glycosyltransferase family 2 protein [Phycisphaerales bacterium]MCI0629739.1 glycosyltransferase family 2 protein [Phycisphaerales bacterium]MCI0677118.1 glycosyltransferase family 2 protein [Phycisphaerales bacterium]
MIDVMFITFNESINLPRSLDALKGWTNKVFVVDSGSTDGTQDIARQHGATVVQHPWSGYARQKNWGLANLPLEAPWTLILDADEVVTPELRQRLIGIASRQVESVPENGFFINRVTYFLGRPIRHCGYFPSWNLRFFKRGRARYEDRVVHEHMIIEDPVGYVREPMRHDDRRGLEHYVAKHNRYSTLEAKALYAEIKGHLASPAAKLPRETNWRRWLKRNVLPHVPMPWIWRFLYMYVLRLGVLDGQAGLEFCKFISMYDYLVSLKLRALRKQALMGDETVLDLLVEPMLVQHEAEVISELRFPAAGALTRTLRSGALSGQVDLASPSVAEPSNSAPVLARSRTATASTGGTTAPLDGMSKVSAAGAPHLDGQPSLERRADGVSILILTLNEETNLPECLESVKGFDDIVVFDSYSTDGTVAIAQSRGARVVQRKFDNWSAHQNWAMENIDFAHKWVFYLDADERMTDELKDELLAIGRNPSEENVAFYCGRKNFFMGRWIKHSMPPGLIMRFFRPEKIRFERLVNPTPIIDGQHGYLKSFFHHFNFSKGVSEWIEKHNSYSRMEAMEGLKVLRGELGEQPSFLSRDRALRRKALKNLSFRLPFRPALKFMYMYFIRLGILDGLAGFTYCTLQAFYEYMIVIKMRELRRRERGQPI